MTEIGISTIRIDTLETRVNIQTAVVICTKDVAAFKEELRTVVDKYAI
jgi:hypothetical protein